MSVISIENINCVSIEHCEIAEDGSSENSDVGVDDVDQDLAVLDLDMRTVLENNRLRGDEKWLQYFRALERYLYKKDPSFKPTHFKFDIQEDSDGRIFYTVKREKSFWKRYGKYIPSLLGPVIGASLTTLFRS